MGYCNGTETAVWRDKLPAGLEECPCRIFRRLDNRQSGNLATGNLALLPECPQLTFSSSSSRVPTYRATPVPTQHRDNRHPPKMPISITKEQAVSCCASPGWAERLASGSPYCDFSSIIDAARRVWWAETGASEWLKAFAAHPRIGDNKAVEEKPAAFAAFSRSEQAAANESSSADVAQELLRWNRCPP